MNTPSTVTPNGSLKTALPMTWVDRIFENFIGRFGNSFAAKWASGVVVNGLDAGIENAKRVWAKGLYGYSSEELKRGLAQRYAFPPSLDEFQTSCRPAIESKAAWAEAVEQMAVRTLSGDDRWTRPEIFWAAAKVGSFDLAHLSWEQIRSRWERALAEAIDAPVPAFRLSLPAPGDTVLTRDEARYRLAQLRRQMHSGTVQ